jgi:hypothetical protein
LRQLARAQEPDKGHQAKREMEALHVSLFQIQVWIQCTLGACRERVREACLNTDFELFSQI